jgi:hypothetical protein
VELAPAILPPLGHLAERCGRERGEHARGRRAVGGELDRPCGGLGLLEPLRCEIDEAGTKRLGLAGGNRDCGADQRKALFSFSKKLGSCR